MALPLALLLPSASLPPAPKGRIVSYPLPLKGGLCLTPSP